MQALHQVVELIVECGQVAEIARRDLPEARANAQHFGDRAVGLRDPSELRQRRRA